VEEDRTLNTETPNIPQDDEIYRSWKDCESAYDFADYKLGYRAGYSAALKQTLEDIRRELVEAKRREERREERLMEIIRGLLMVGLWPRDISGSRIVDEAFDLLKAKE
jgi:hypothetical protein